MSTEVERFDHHITLEYTRLLEIPRPYILPMSLRLEGDALLIDEKMVLAFKKDPRYPNQLFITRHKSVNITLIKEDGSFRTFGFINPDEIEEPFVTLGLGLTRSRPCILIGDAYKVIFQEGARTEVRFSFESTGSIEALPVSGFINHPKLLDDLSRKNQPQ